MPATTGTDPAAAAAHLVAGRLVALPTETVYGLGANALDEVAVSRVFAAKNRPSFDPLIIHQATADRILAWVSELPAGARRLAEALWPGPLTLVLPRHPAVPDLVTAGLPTVAVRVPDHELTRAVLAAVDFPVAAPSANPFGYVSPVTAGHVADRLGDRLDYILDGGACRVGLESTIVSFADPARPVVLRKGGTTLEELRDLTGGELAVMTHGSSRPAAPGMLSQHYAPATRLELIAPGQPLPVTEAGTGHAVVGFGPAHGPSRGDFVNLSASGDLAEAARGLFSLLRSLDDRAYRRATVQLLPERGLGVAINDRLRRAAAR